ncbi:hypothetical protein Q9R19_11740 [Microbacterium sp. ARD32]|uniref:hypothetical protein n=1 Tax=Microbacterium sp. ARD32 TaxID=2962577 RepID=UPI002881832C|nr:hypothetical protein [Microbacterium sp. ARD32]MDT0158300.1 hypothetical protein [Microbacterium sp. ARD32]
MSGIDEGMLPEHVQPGQQDEERPEDEHAEPAEPDGHDRPEGEERRSGQARRDRSTEPDPIDVDQSSE